jgi:hypothetical protein
LEPVKVRFLERKNADAESFEQWIEKEHGFEPLINEQIWSEFAADVFEQQRVLKVVQANGERIRNNNFSLSRRVNEAMKFKPLSGSQNYTS